MRVVVVPVLSDNYSYLLIDDEKKIAACVDPAEAHLVLAKAKEEKVEIVAVLTTHHHMDHAGGNAEMVKQVAGVKVYGGRIDKVAACTNPLEHGDKFNIGSIEVLALHTPGHTRGSICYFCTETGKEKEGLVFTGDTLFVAGHHQLSRQRREGSCCATASPVRHRVFVSNIHMGFRWKRTQPWISWNPKDQLQGVCQLSGATWAFAAVKSDGSVVTWGDERKGGNSSHVQEQLVNVKKVCASSWSFAALRCDGHVVTWGVDRKGGDSRSVQSQLHHVLQLRSSSWAFAALRSDGQVITWGDPTAGGDSSQVQHKLKSICQICASADAFAALNRQGSVIIWGSSLYGSLHNLCDVQRISANTRAFAALKKDGTVVAFGDRSKGGDVNSQVQAELLDVQQICGSSWAFAALLGDKTVVTWGDSLNGGDSSAVKERLQDVVELFA